MEKSTKILSILGILGIGGYFLWKNKNKSVSTEVVDKIKVIDTASTPSKIEWKETQSAGASFMETNLQILVNGEEKVLEFFNNSGTLNVSDGDMVNIFVWSAVGSYGSTPWIVSGTNNLLVTDDGQEIYNKTLDKQDNMSYSFIVKGGHTYKINNYTIPSNN